MIYTEAGIYNSKFLKTFFLSSFKKEINKLLTTTENIRNKKGLLAITAKKPLNIFYIKPKIITCRCEPELLVTRLHSPVF